MKKTKVLFLTAALSAVSVILCSCTKQTGSVLWYEKYPLTAEIESDDAALTVTVSESGEITVTVREPEGLAGVKFTFGERDTVTAGDMEIPISRESAERVLAIAGAFMLDESGITSVTSDGDETIVTFRTDEGTYEMTYDKDGAPSAFIFRSGEKIVQAKITKIIPAEDGISIDQLQKKDVNENDENTEKQGVG